MGEKTYAVISFDGTGVEALQSIIALASNGNVRLEGLITNEIVKNALDGLIDVLSEYQPTNAVAPDKNNK